MSFITKEEIVQNIVTHRRSHPDEFPFVEGEVCLGSNQSFRYHGMDGIVTIEPEQERNNPDFVEIFRSAGLAIQKFTFMTSNYQDRPRSTSTANTNLGTWLNELAGTHNLLQIILDTNQLISHTISSHFSFLLGGPTTQNVSIMIPRLAVLELERIANNEKEEKKRRALFAFRELIFLNSGGARMLPLLNSELLNGFTSNSGKLMTDAWIRREIIDYIRNSHFGITVQDAPRIEVRIVFMTSDLVSALSAEEPSSSTVLKRTVKSRSQFRILYQVKNLVWDNKRVSAI